MAVAPTAPAPVSTQPPAIFAAFSTAPAPIATHPAMILADAMFEVMAALTAPPEFISQPFTAWPPAQIAVVAMTVNCGRNTAVMTPAATFSSVE